MSPPPNRIAMMANLATRLAAIQYPAYKCTVTEVGRVYETWDDVATSRMPFVGLLPLNNPIEYHPGNRAVQRSRVNLYCYVQGQTATERITALENLVSDVFQTVAVDPTLTGTCITTTILDYTTDEGDPDSRTGVACAEVQLELVFERDSSGGLNP
jgi:hypothetical protein